MVFHFGAHAAVLRVGPGQLYQRVADAIAAAQDGDTVRIAPGTYRGDVALIKQRRLTLEGEAGQPRPVLEAAGQAVEGKAIWVVRQGQIVVRHLEFRGARVAGGNGAGIRFEGGLLRVENCLFTDNQMGLLTSNDGDAELDIESSEFSAAPREPGSLHHLLYVGRIKRFSVRGSHFHGGYLGHLIKSRARQSTIEYNLINDGPQGRASYEIDLPNGGLAIVRGNLIGQSADTDNPVMVAFGAEGQPWPDSRLLMSHNTLHNALRQGAPTTWFLRSWPERLPEGATVRAVNNLALGTGQFSAGTATASDGNRVWADAPSAPGQHGFKLPMDSPWFGSATDPQHLAGDDALPRAEPTPPLGWRALLPPARWTPGALQR